jgi:hypothetical protein
MGMLTTRCGKNAMSIFLSFIPAPRMADGEECVRVGSGDMANAVSRDGITVELWSKHTVSTRALGAW